MLRGCGVVVRTRSVALVNRNVIRHLLTALAVLAIGPMAGAIAGDVRLPGGAGGATAFTSESPLRGGTLLLIALAIVGATGTLAARLCGTRHGLLCAGLVAAWVAWRQGTVEGVLMNARSGRPLTALALEGALVGCAAVVMVWLVALAGREKGEGKVPVLRRPGGGLVLTVVLAGAAGVLGAYLFGVEGIKGQTVFAAFVGAVLAGAAARLVQSEPEGEPGDIPGLGAFVALGLLAVGAPVWAMWSHGSGLVEATFAGHLTRLANLGPADWLAGGLLGVPIGSAWASAMIVPGQPAG